MTVHGWMRRISKRLVSRRRKIWEISTILSKVRGSRLHAETGCRKVHAWEVSE